MNGRLDWMSHLPDDVSISNISIPGTHDSGTFSYLGPIIESASTKDRMEATIAFRFVQCQHLDFKQQLELGVRFLDLRIMPGEDFPLYHGTYALGINLREAMDVVDQYLDDYPSETILVCIKKENEDDLAQMSRELKTWLDRRKRPLYVKAAIPKLGEVRGKAVLINRVQGLDGNGIYLKLEDNRIFDKVETQADAAKTEIKLAAQDYYTPQTSWYQSNFKAKVKAIEEAYRKYATGTFDLRMNYMSAGNIPTRTPQQYAQDINPLVDGFLRQCAGETRWITILDYVGSHGEGQQEPVAAIISHNNFIDIKAKPERDTLASGEELKPGERLLSKSRAYEAKFQTDGNMVVYRIVDGQAMAAAGTHNRSATRATLQEDGNFVIYNGDTPLGATDTNGAGKCRLVMQNDGNLVLYDSSNAARWASVSNGFSRKT